MKKISYFFLACGLVVLASCNKEDVKSEKANETTINTRGADADYERLAPYFEMTAEPKDSKFADFYAENLDRATQRFTVNANRPIAVRGRAGTVLTLPANSMVNADGTGIKGNVEIELIEVLDRGTMVLLDRGTSGYNAETGAVDALTSGGEFFVRVTQDGEEVVLTAPMRVTVPNDAPDADMKKFKELDRDADDLLWVEEEEEKVDVEGKGDGGSYGYNILPGTWGWTNIDKFYNDPCAKTPIFVEVPSGYDNTNTEVYLSYDGDPGKLANFDMWNGTRFTEHYGQICIGLPVHFIAVSNLGGGLEYAIQPAVIVSGHVEVIAGFTPISEAALIALINGLP